MLLKGGIDEMGEDEGVARLAMAIESAGEEVVVLNVGRVKGSEEVGIGGDEEEGCD